jgi:hypothetical protein
MTQNPAISLNAECGQNDFDLAGIVHETSINIGEIDLSREMELDPLIMTHRY